MDEKQMIQDTRRMASRTRAHLEAFRLEHSEHEGTKPLDMPPKVQKVYDILELAAVRAVDAAEGREPTNTGSIRTTVLRYAKRLFDDVTLTDNPSGHIGELEDVHRALLCVGFKPDTAIVLKMAGAYRHARRTLGFE